MGEVEVPADAYYGASTQRAVLNFPISGQPFPRRFIRALGMVKKAAAQTNLELGLLSRRRARVIAAAAQEVIDGKLDNQFPIDIYQTGSGTSTNTNATTNPHRATPTISWSRTVTATTSDASAWTTSSADSVRAVKARGVQDGLNS